MKYSVSVIFIFLFILHSIHGQSQNDSTDRLQNKNDFSAYPLYEFNYGMSKLMTEYTSLYHRASHFVELRLAKQTRGKNLWQSEYGFPEVGATIVFGDLGSPKDFGYALGIIPEVTLNSLSSKTFSIKIRLGLGMAYFTNPYDSSSNTENTYIGSKLANMSVASFTFNHKLSKQLYFQYGINYYHCSNGHYQVPNVGMNQPGFKIGVKYYPKGKPNSTKPNPVKSEPDKWRVNIRTGLGVHEFAGTLGPVGGPKYRINTLDIFLSKRKNTILNFQLGLALKYYTDYYHIAQEEQLFKEPNKWDASVLTIFVGNEFLLHKVGISVQTGYDLHKSFEQRYLEFKQEELNFGRHIEEFVSSKFGINYYLIQPAPVHKALPFIGIYLKTNFGMADFVGFHVGISI